MKRVVVFTIAFCAWLTSVAGAQDSIVITDVEDIHIVNQLAIDQYVPSPNNGNAKMFAIAGFKC